MGESDFDKSFRRFDLFVKIFIGGIFVLTIALIGLQIYAASKVVNAVATPGAAEQAGKAIGSFAAQFQKGLEEGKKAP